MYVSFCNFIHPISIKQLFILLQQMLPKDKQQKSDLFFNSGWSLECQFQ